MAKLDNYECDGQMELLSFMTESFTPIDLGIGIGRNNGTKRSDLPAAMGEKTDREAREKLNQYRKAGAVIINEGRGKGYYRPLPEDYPHVLKHYKAEESRINDLIETFKAEKEWLESMKSRGVVG